MGGVVDATVVFIDVSISMYRNRHIDVIVDGLKSLAQQNWRKTRPMDWNIYLFLHFPPHDSPNLIYWHRGSTLIDWRRIASYLERISYAGSRGLPGTNPAKALVNGLRRYQSYLLGTSKVNIIIISDFEVSIEKDRINNYLDDLEHLIKRRTWGRKEVNINLYILPSPNEIGNELIKRIEEFFKANILRLDPSLVVETLLRQILV